VGRAGKKEENRVGSGKKKNILPNKKGTSLGWAPKTVSRPRGKKNLMGVGVLKKNKGKGASGAFLKILRPHFQRGTSKHKFTSPNKTQKKWGGPSPPQP